MNQGKAYRLVGHSVSPLVPGLGIAASLISWVLIFIFAVASQQNGPTSASIAGAGASGFIFWIFGRVFCFTVKDKKCRWALAASLLCDVALFVCLSQPRGRFDDPGSLIAISLGLIFWLVFLRHLSVLIEETLLEKRSFRSLILASVSLGLLVVYLALGNNLALWYGFSFVFILAAVSSVFLTIHAMVSTVRS